MMFNPKPSYIPSAPGDDYDADAFNLVLAGLGDNWKFAHDIVDHEITEDAAECMLATVSAWLVIILKGLPREYRNHLLGHLREQITER